jgi:hypothetical protein
MDSRYVQALLPGVLGELQKQNRAKQYFGNPVMWARDHLGVILWDAQADAAMAVVSNKNVVVKAGHEVGKSFLAGILICWWIDTRWDLPGSCFVVSTAPSNKQINAIVWREVRRFHKASSQRHEEYKRRVRLGMPLGDYVTNDHRLPGAIVGDAPVKWKLPDGTELGYGSKPPETKEDTMSGIHARYVLAIGDEAVGLTEGLIQDLQNITSNATSRRFLICNPTNPLSYVGQIFKENTGTWTLQTISVYDSPNFHGNGDEVYGDQGQLVRTPCDENCPLWEIHKDMEVGLGLGIEVLETLVDQTYVADMLRDYGKEHPTYISRVLGEFAWDAGPTLIKPEEMAVALDCEVTVLHERPVLGVDVSRSDKGDKNTVYACWRGVVKGTDITAEKVRHVDSWNDADAMRTAQKIHELAMSKGAWLVYIDGSGLGGPIADRVREIAQGRYEVWDAIGGKTDMPELEKDRYYNCRAKWYSDLRHKIAGGYMDIDIDDDKLQEELLGIETKFPRQGVQKLLIESKEDMRKRGVKSPDYADGCMYSQIDFEYYNVYGPRAGDRYSYDTEYGVGGEYEYNPTGYRSSV